MECSTARTKQHEILLMVPVQRYHGPLQKDIADALAVGRKH